MSTEMNTEMNTETSSNDVAVIEARLAEAQQDFQKARENLVEARRSVPPQEVEDYSLLAADGQSVPLSSLFGGMDQLILVHNMGTSCVYCTLWADNFNGALQHLQSRAGFAVVSPDAPAVQQKFAAGRGWNFPMYSAKGSSFSKDLGFETEDVKMPFMPGVSVFQKGDAGRITRVAKDFFGPGDLYCNVWHFFDLLPNGANDWQPQFNY